MDKPEYTPEEFASAREERRQKLERTYSHEGYFVIRKELFPHLRDPALSVRDGSITFNTACIKALEGIVYVRFEINEELKRLAVKPCDENDKDAVRWCVAKPDLRKSREIRCPDVTDKLYNLMGWDKSCRYKMLAYMIAPEGVDFYIIDLLAWEKVPIGKRRKKAMEAADAMEPIESGETAGASPEQQTETTETTPTMPTTPTKPPIEERFSAEVAGSFGVSVDQYQRDREVRNTDGFVTMGLINGSK